MSGSICSTRAIAGPCEVIDDQELVKAEIERMKVAKPLHAALRRFARRARRAGFAVAHGRRVTEFLPRGVDKGNAIRALRRLLEPDSVFYFGDSPGDEPAFAALARRDLGVRVGSGPTKADYRIPGPRDVDRFLRAVLAARAAPARKRR